MKNRRPTQPDLFDFIPSLFDFPVVEASDAPLFDVKAAMFEAAAENAANAEAWDMDRDEEAYIELLALEAEAADEYRQACRWGAWA